LAGFAVVVALAFPACGNFRRGRDCKQFIETINARVKQIQDQPLSDNTDIATVVKEARQLALSYEQLAASVGALELKSSDVRAGAESYRGLAARAAGVLRDVALAVERMDSRTAQQKRIEFTGMEREERQLVQRIETLCHGR
jgi:hypothetical protein